MANRRFDGLISLQTAVKPQLAEVVEEYGVESGLSNQEIIIRALCDYLKRAGY